MLRTVPSARSRCGLVKTSSVGRFGAWTWPWTVRSRPAIQRAPSISPTSRSVPGAAVAQRGERALGELARAGLELVQARCQAAGGVGLVEAQRVREGVPQAVDVGLAERLARPALGRVGDERPRELAAHDAVHPHAVEVAEACAREPLAVEALVDLGARVGRDADDGRADLDRALEPRDHPRRRPAEHLVGRRRRRSARWTQRSA